MDVLFEDEAMRVKMHLNPKPETDRVLVSFSGVGHRMGMVDVQQPEFFRSGRSYARIFFIDDMKRSWGNGLDFGRLKELIDGYRNGQPVDTIGNSMGGYLALLASRFLPVRTALAFSPQFSVHPGVVPWETRWQTYRAGITDWRIESLEGMIPPETAAYAIFGTASLDVGHMALLTRSCPVNVTVIPGGRHNLGRLLKERGLLHEVVHRCFDGSYAADWLIAELQASEPKRESISEPRQPRASLPRRALRRLARFAKNIINSRTTGA